MHGLWQKKLREPNKIIEIILIISMGRIHKEKDMLILAKSEGNPSVCIHKNFKQNLMLLEQKHNLILS